jgi:hypothetical protein
VIYDGEVRYMQGPQYDVGPFRARVLDQGFLEVDGAGLNRLNAEVDVFPVVATISYNRVSDDKAPILYGDSAREPSFTGDFTEVSLSGTSSVATSSFSELGTYSYSSVFSPPQLFGQAKCFEKGYSGKGSNCAESIGNDYYVRGVLHVKGTGRTSKFRGEERKSEVCGRAQLILQRETFPGSNVYKDAQGLDKGVELQDMTGQAFQGEGGNFVPRGYVRRESDVLVDSGIVAMFYENERATEAFKGEIKFKVGANYRIAVRTQVDTSLKMAKPCAKGEVTYEIEGGSVYFPKIEAVQEQVKCAETVRSCESPSQCTPIEYTTKALKAKIPLDKASSLIVGPPRVLPQSLGKQKIDCDVPIPASLVPASIDRSQLTGACSCVDAKLTIGESVPTTTDSKTCDTNYGISDGELANGAITNSAQAQAVCAVESSIGNLKFVPEQNIRRRWNTKEIELADKIKVPALDCKDTDHKEISERVWSDKFTAYKQPFKDETRVLSSTEPGLRETGAESQEFPVVDPKDPILLSKEPAYSCGEFSVVTKPVKELVKKAEFLTQTSLFESQAPRANCLGGDDRNAWKRMLSAHLRKTYLNVDNAFFVPKYQNAGVISKISCGAKVNYLTEDEAASCSAYTSSSADNIVSFRLRGDFDERNLPAECYQSCNSCQLELVGFKGDTKPKLTLMKERAIAKGRRELAAFSPWLSRSCGQQDCAQLEVSNEDSRPRVTAQIKVPLFSKALINSFGGSSWFNDQSFLELEYYSEENYERDIALID